MGLCQEQGWDCVRGNDGALCCFRGSDGIVSGAVMADGTVLEAMVVLLGALVGLCDKQNQTFSNYLTQPARGSTA